MTIQYPSHLNEKFVAPAGAASGITGSEVQASENQSRDVNARAISEETPARHAKSAGGKSGGRKALPDISYNERSGRGRYWAVTSAGEAELTYLVEDAGGGDARIVIKGTFVPIAARRAGIGKALIAKAASDARSAGRKVVADCPFVASVLGIDPAAGALQGDDGR